MKRKESKSIPWYNDYNMTKHNREEHLCFAKLSHAIESVCAAVILLCAQFGPRVIPQEFYLTMNLPNPDWFYIPLINTRMRLNERDTYQCLDYKTERKWKEIFQFF